MKIRDILTPDEWFYLFDLLSADGSERAVDIMGSLLAEVFPTNEKGQGS